MVEYVQKKNYTHKIGLVSKICIINLIIIRHNPGMRNISGVRVCSICNSFQLFPPPLQLQLPIMISFLALVGPGHRFQKQFQENMVPWTPSDSICLSLFLRPYPLRLGLLISQENQKIIDITVCYLITSHQYCGATSCLWRLL